MGVIIKVKIEEKTGELIKVISQFQGAGHVPKMLGKEPAGDPQHQVVLLEFKADANTIRALAEDLGLQIEDITESEAAGKAPDNTVAAADAALDLDQLRTRYIDAVGPIGGTLFDEAVETVGDALGTPEGNRKLVERLADQIDEEDEAFRFRQFAGFGI